MSPRGLPQAAPRGFPQDVSATHVAADLGNAAHGHARAGNRLSMRFGSTAAAPRRDDVLDRIIREAEGAFPRAAHRPNIAPAFLGADDEARPQRRDEHNEARAEVRKSTTSLVARLAVALFKQRRGDEASTRRAVGTLQIIPRRGAETSSRGLDEHAQTCRGSSRRPPETYRGAPPHHFHSLNVAF